MEYDKNAGLYIEEWKYMVVLLGNEKHYMIQWEAELHIAVIEQE